MANLSAKLRLSVGIFGRRNGGKSSIFNRLARHNAAIVSPQAGTTTDPVKKAMEHHFLGPLMLIDTGGLDDEGALGRLRVEKAAKIMETCDVAIIVTTPGNFGAFEEELINGLKTASVPFVAVFNKSDLTAPGSDEIKMAESFGGKVITASALTGDGMEELYLAISGIAPNYWLESRPIIRDLYNPDETALLIIDSPRETAPGRIPTIHNRIIRDALDNDSICGVIPSGELKNCLDAIKTLPTLAVADSGVYPAAADLLPQSVPLTTASIIFSRLSGDIIIFSRNAADFFNLKQNSSILMANLSVSEFSQDPELLTDLSEKMEKASSKTFCFTFAGRKEIPDDLSGFALVVLFGEETLTVTKTIKKIQSARESRIPLTGYDFIMAAVDESYRRAFDLFMEKYDQLKNVWIRS